ncbi:hypothetical protein B0H13DRAFT_2683009 [Mycena leptocephala]|nr:hypothetical protein B0H13DRAFT_2683009 [Mycena leptocephala]
MHCPRKRKCILSRETRPHQQELPFHLYQPLRPATETPTRLLSRPTRITLPSFFLATFFFSLASTTPPLIRTHKQRPHSSPSFISPRPHPAPPIHPLFTATISARGPFSTDHLICAFVRLERVATAQPARECMTTVTTARDGTPL